MSPQRPEILIVESQRQSVAELLRFLHGKGVDVMVALTVADGFRKACEGQPDVVLLNIDLPGGEGISVLHRLRSEMSTAHMPVLVLSSRRTVACKREAYRAGAADYLVKPLREKALMARLFVHFRLEFPATQHPLSGALSSFFEQSSRYESQVVMEAVALLQQGDMAWPGAKALAHQLGVTEDELEQAFDWQFGLNAEMFHCRQRLEWARTQLQATAQPTADIARAMGCRHPSEFAQLFRRHYGVSPDDYRQLR